MSQRLPGCPQFQLCYMLKEGIKKGVFKLVKKSKARFSLSFWMWRIIKVKCHKYAVWGTKWAEYSSDFVLTFKLCPAFFLSATWFELKLKRNNPLHSLLDYQSRSYRLTLPQTCVQNECVRVKQSNACQNRILNMLISLRKSQSRNSDCWLGGSDKSGTSSLSASAVWVQYLWKSSNRTTRTD